MRARHETPIRGRGPLYRGALAFSALVLVGSLAWTPAPAAGDSPKVQNNTVRSSGGSSGSKASPKVRSRSTRPPARSRSTPPRGASSRDRSTRDRSAGRPRGESRVHRQHRDVERRSPGYRSSSRHYSPPRGHHASPKHPRRYSHRRYYPRHHYPRHYYPRYVGWRHYYPYFRFWGPFPVYYPYWGPTIHVDVGGRYDYRAGVGMGALDLDVSPEKAEIYIDGQYVGVADEYDGFPQYLWLEKGTYDVAFYHEGRETILRQYTIYPGVVIDVDDRMRPGVAVPPEELMTPPSTERRDERLRRNEERRAEAERRAAVEEVRDQEMGRLLLDAWPPDTAVYLDGHFLGVADELAGLSAGLLVEPGRHELQLVRPGHVTEEMTVDVSPGERLELALELEPEGP